MDRELRVHRGKGYLLEEKNDKYILSVPNYMCDPVCYEISKENFELALQSDEDAQKVIFYTENGFWPPTPEERREHTRNFLRESPDLLVKIPKNQDYFTHDELVEIFEANHMDLKDVVK